jgi:hypothetical protein
MFSTAMRVLGKGEREFDASTKATRVGRFVAPHVFARLLVVKSRTGDCRPERQMLMTDSGGACLTPRSIQRSG